jgi:hypothetical protein
MEAANGGTTTEITKKGKRTDMNFHPATSDRSQSQLMFGLTGV